MEHSPNETRMQGTGSTKFLLNKNKRVLDISLGYKYVDSFLIYKRRFGDIFKNNHSWKSSPSENQNVLYFTIALGKIQKAA